MGINIKNNRRLVNAKLGIGKFTTYGRFFAVGQGLDGWAIIDIEAMGVPDEIKSFLEGNDKLSYFAVPSNVEKLCSYALASFPNVSTVYITNYDNMIDLSANNVFGGLNQSPTIYVPEKYLDDYQNNYPNYNFTTWVQNADLYISNNGNSKLTLDYVNAVVYGLDVGTDASITRTFVGSDFTTFEFGAMDFVFEGRVHNSTIELDNEIMFLSSAFSTSQEGVTLEVE